MQIIGIFSFLFLGQSLYSGQAVKFSRIAPPGKEWTAPQGRNTQRQGTHVQRQSTNTTPRVSSPCPVSAYLCPASVCSCPDVASNPCPGGAILKH